jgi:two-component system, NtrC family, C4-dicarboxylate transport response regulator DctD
MHILLVDDDSDVVEAIGNGLRRKGYQVRSFLDSAKALANFVPQTYDIAVLDVRMGAMDGLELYRRLKGLDSQLAVCFLTAYADVIRDKPGGVRFLQKPISLAELVRALEEVGPRI